MPEISLPALIVGERRVIHHLQKDVKNVGVGLLDLIEQQDRVGVLADLLDQHSPLVVPHVARRSADQTGHRVLLHVLTHIEAQEWDAQAIRQLLAQFRLAHAGGSGEQKRTHWPIHAAESRARSLHRLGHRANRRWLTEDGL